MESDDGSVHTYTCTYSGEEIKRLMEEMEKKRKDHQLEQDRPLPPLSSASTDGFPHPTSLTDMSLLISVLEGRLGLSASVLSPEQRKLLHTQMKTFMANHRVGLNYRARNMPSKYPIRMVEGAERDALFKGAMNNSLLLGKLFEMREMTKEIARGVSG